MTTTDTTTHTLRVPGASVVYDLHPGSSSGLTPLFMIGSPMAAPGFATLLTHFTDRTVITYDPRGSERSRLEQPAVPTPEDHADDLHRIIQEAGEGAVHMFASSGGAVNALALVAAHPQDVTLLVAHEPPLPAILPDREAALAVSRSVADTYQQRGWGAAMAHFIAAASHKGEYGPEWAQQPAPDPAAFGLPAEDDGSRDDPLLGMGIVGSIGYEPDFDALSSASTRIVPAGGVESNGEMPYRSAVAVAERLGVDLVEFPSNHGGFLGGEYGQMGDPDAFAAKLREVLGGS